MSRSTAKGTWAETAVTNYLNTWCDADDRNWSAMGMPFDRKRSKGSNDEGDVFGPFTMVEVKNHYNPVVGTLLANAEWKAKNAGRPIWCLCWKVKGYGLKNIGMWECATTVEGFRGMCHELDIDEDTDFQWLVAHPTQEITGMCGRGRQMSFQMHDLRQWNAGNGPVQAVREATWDQRPNDDIIPVLVQPRRTSGGEMMPFDRWTVSFKLYGLGRLLEAIGVLPTTEPSN